MATRNIDKFGRQLGRTGRTIKASTGRVGTNFSLIEATTDIITPLSPYHFDFYTYTESPSVYLDITIMEKFKVLL